jgi:hypothetical protein
MKDSSPGSRPLAIERVRQRFEEWRRTRTPGRRSLIPAALWGAAIALARQQGVYATSRLLRLDYAALKRRVATTAGDRPRPPAVSHPTLIELMPAPGQGSSARCLIEIESPCGGRMRVQMPQVTVPDLVALTCGVWSGGMRR